MNRGIATLAALLLPVLAGCAAEERLPPEPVDCSVLEAYEFRNISSFDGSAEWFRYADPTPGGVPDLVVDPETGMAPENSDVPIGVLEAPGRCGDTQFLLLEAEGHNFWGSGFGDWGHNNSASRANGTGYEGISFWARSARNSEKTFLLNVDDGRTILLNAQEGAPPYEPGTVVAGTSCRYPPPEELGNPACYEGGVNQPSSAGNRVPAPDECGNSFHTLITTTEEWQLFLIPWRDLVQWPCPNRLEGGINPADIAKFEIKFEQGTRYEVWLDNLAFYRRR